MIKPRLWGGPIVRRSINKTIISIFLWTMLCANVTNVQLWKQPLKIWEVIIVWIQSNQFLRILKILPCLERIFAQFKYHHVLIKILSLEWIFYILSKCWGLYTKCLHFPNVICSNDCFNWDLVGCLIQRLQTFTSFRLFM